MMLQIIALQNFLNLYGHGLKVDGAPGPQTRAARDVTHQNLLVAYGGMPVFSRGTEDRGDDLEEHAGRASTYGGPEDPGDYYEGQSYMPTADPDGGGPLPALMSPAEYLARPNVQQFRPYLRVREMSLATAWPVINGRRVGVSYYLDPESPYGAFRFRGTLLRRAKAGEEILVRIVNRNIVDSRGKYGFREKIVRGLDWGPREWFEGKPWWARVDLAPGVYRDLQLKHQYDRTRGVYLDHVMYEVLQ